jgi:hypothetical protein
MTEIKNIIDSSSVSYEVFFIAIGYLLTKFLSSVERRATGAAKKVPVWWRSRTARSRAKRLTELRPKARYLRTLARSENRRALLRADADRLTHNSLTLLFMILILPLMLSQWVQGIDKWLRTGALLLYLVFIEVWKWPRDKRYMIYRAEKLVVRREAFERNSQIRSERASGATSPQVSG